MKYISTLAMTILLISCINGQRLGFSGFSSASGAENAGNHTFHYVAGESVITKDAYDAHTLHNGILQNLAVDKFYDSYIQVRYFLDENENGEKDPGEIFLQLGAFTLNDEDTYLNYSKQGTVLKTSEGNYKIQYTNIGADNWQLTTTDVTEVQITDVSKTAEVLFGLAAIEQKTEVRAYFSSTRFRCFGPADYTISIQNNGTVNEVDVVYVKLDERIEDIFFTEAPDVIVSDHEVGWEFELGPTESRQIEFSITVPGVGTVNFPGDIFNSSVWIESDQELTEFVYDQEILCSYDPNDKLVNPDRPDGLGLLDEPITYTIRFQNTGNDYAENVVVTDTLSEHLDMSTFRLINTSHPRLLEVISDPDNDHILNFTFNQIYLPDSTTNELGSNGHIMYSISALAGLPENTEIKNTAHIYFDFNPAVVTNTTSTTLVEMFPVDNTDDITAAWHISFFPNPTTGDINIEESVEAVVIYDLYGKEVLRKTDTKRIEAGILEAGSYLIEMSKGDKRFVDKIVILK